MNSTLEANIRQADGRYLSDDELNALEAYTKSYGIRLVTYSILCEKANALIQKALDQLAITDGQTVREHRSTCERDMGYVLRSISVAILRDDNESFRQQLILWMQNIMASLRKESQSARAYHLLQAVVQAELPGESARLVNENLDEFIRALTTNV